MKLFCVSDTDWYAAEDRESAISFICADTGNPENEIKEDMEEVSDAEMLLLSYFYEDGNSNMSRTFAAQLEIELQDGQPFPRFFASTEQ